MEEKLQNLKDMHDILEHMHKIGDEWHTELVMLRAKNQDLIFLNLLVQSL